MPAAHEQRDVALCMATGVDALHARDDLGPRLDRAQPIADRLRAGPGSRIYGAPSVLAQLACEVRMLRRVDPAVFRPRPRVDSGILRLRRTGPGADAATRWLVRAAFAHRRKTLARSVELDRPGSLAEVRAALRELGHAEDARAEALAPPEFAALAARLARGG